MSLPVVCWVAVGGAVGAALRYGMIQAVAPAARQLGGWPIATLLVNVFGSLLIGFIAIVLLQRPFDPLLRPLLIVGVLGSFTTFSTFSLDTVVLLERGDWLLAVTNVLANLLLCLLACALGLWLGRLVS